MSSIGDVLEEQVGKYKHEGKKMDNLLAAYVLTLSPWLPLSACPENLVLYQDNIPYLIIS